MTPNMPSEPITISRRAGPIAVCGVSRVESSPVGVISLTELTIESKRP